MGGVHRPAGAQPRGGRSHITGVTAGDVRAAARLLRHRRRNGAIYYGLGVTEHSQGSTMVMGMANLAMATGNIGRDGVGRQPAARAEQRAGLLRHGLVPARAARLPARRRRRRCATSTTSCGASPFSTSPGCASPTCSTRRIDGLVPGAVRAGRGHRPVRPEHPPRPRGAGGAGAAGRAGPVRQRDGEVRARAAARHVVPGEGRHLHQRRAADQPGAPGDGAEDRQAGVGDRLRDRPGHGLPDALRQRRARSWTRSR